MADLVSVIIPAYNRRADLCECIESLLRQDYCEIEIIVVDDCSTDDTVDYISSHYENIIIIESRYNCGPSYLRNKGLKKCGGKYVLFLDSDTVLHDERIISEMVRILEKDGTIGQIGGEIPVYLGIDDKAFGNNGFGVKVIASKYETNGSRMKRCDYLATCNCMVRKEVAELIGGFDPYYRYGCEDVDFGYAIQKRGFTNWVCYDTAVHHRHVLSGRYADEAYRFKHTRVRFFMKHYSFHKFVYIFLLDIIKFMTFYFSLAPKIIYKMLRNEKIVRLNITGGYHNLEAYIANIPHFVTIRKSGGTNYLDEAEMEKYEAYLIMNGGKR